MPVCACMCVYVRVVCVCPWVCICTCLCELSCTSVLWRMYMCMCVTYSIHCTKKYSLRSNQKEDCSVELRSIRSSNKPSCILYVRECARCAGIVVVCMHERVRARVFLNQFQRERSGCCVRWLLKVRGNAWEPWWYSLLAAGHWLDGTRWHHMSSSPICTQQMFALGWAVVPLVAMAIWGKSKNPCAWWKFIEETYYLARVDANYYICIWFYNTKPAPWHVRQTSQPKVLHVCPCPLQVGHSLASFERYPTHTKYSSEWKGRRRKGRRTEEGGGKGNKIQQYFSPLKLQPGHFCLPNLHPLSHTVPSPPHRKHLRTQMSVTITSTSQMFFLLLLLFKWFIIAKVPLHSAWYLFCTTATKTSSATIGITLLINVITKRKQISFKCVCECILSWCCVCFHTCPDPWQTKQVCPTSHWEPSQPSAQLLQLEPITGWREWWQIWCCSQSRDRS